MAEIIEFETDRLRLRQWLAKDREPFAALNADPRVMEFFLPLSIELRAMLWRITAKH
jgi:RimJ/RimL family protein N-acetyltransferase